MPQKQDDFHCIIIHRKVIPIDGVKSHLTDRKVSFNTLEFNQRSRFLENNQATWLHSSKWSESKSVVIGENVVVSGIVVFFFVSLLVFKQIVKCWKRSMSCWFCITILHTTLVWFCVKPEPWRRRASDLSFSRWNQVETNLSKAYWILNKEEENALST